LGVFFLGLTSVAPVRADFKGAFNKLKKAAEEKVPVSGSASAMGGNSQARENFEKQVKKINETCGSNMSATADFSKFGDSIWACDAIFVELRKACLNLPYETPHPGGMEFISKNVKSVECKAIQVPEGQPAKVSIERSGTKVTFSTVYTQNTESLTEVEFHKKFADLRQYKRVWDFESDMKKNSADLSEACGGEITMSGDVKSWQSRGNLMGYPDLAVTEICTNLVKPVKKACQGADAATIRSNIKTVTCRFGGKQFENAQQGQVKIQAKLQNGDLLLLAGNNIPDPFDEKKVFDYLKSTLKLKTPSPY
jgi:hypothetical protein